MSGVLIIGATTPIGRALVRQISSRQPDCTIIAVGRETSGFSSMWPPGIEYHSVDIRRQRRLRRLLFGRVKEAGIDSVIHLAMHRRARDFGRSVRRLNVEATRALLEMCRAHPTINHFVLRSYAEVYDVNAELPSLICEDHPLNLSPKAPQWVRDRVEADLLACTSMGVSPLGIAVLRCAECIAPRVGSQLYDYLTGRVCLRPLGYDPMMNLISVADIVEALYAAWSTKKSGVFCVPGHDTMPLSEVIRYAGRADVPLPGPSLKPLYYLRSLAVGSDFRYDLNQWRLHFSGVLDGRKTKQELGYVPANPISWLQISTGNFG